MKLRVIRLTASAFILILTVFAPLIAPRQSGAAPAQSLEIRRSFDFRSGAIGWQPDFVGYTQFNQDIYELLAEIRPLPLELGVNGTGFYMQAHNRCDCLVMFLKRQLGANDGVVAGQRYRASFTVSLASNAQSGCVGAGGAPGESVRVLVGASQIEPVTFVGPYDTRRLNVESTVASQAGNIANGRPCDLSSSPFISIERTQQHTREVTADSAGNLWLFVGTGSGFEGFTTLYYQRIDVVLTPLGAPQPNPVIPPRLLTEENTQNAAAVNAQTFTRDPFPFYTRGFFGSDERTHLMLFAANTELLEGESTSTVTVLAEDERGIKFQLPVDSVRRVPDFDWLTQIVVRLPSELTGARNVRVGFNLRGASSNQAGLNVIP
jgi:hypothetical protein